MSSLAYFLLFCFEDTSLVDAKCSSFYYPLLEHTESHCTSLAGQTLLSGNTCVFFTEKKTEKHLLCPSIAQPQLMWAVVNVGWSSGPAGACTGDIVGPKMWNWPAMSSSQPQRPVWGLRLGFKVQDPIWFMLKPHSFRCDVRVACVLWTDNNLTAVSLSVLSSPPMAVIRFTSQLWAWTACPRLWSCPLVHRSPELHVCLTPLIRGRTNRLLEDGGWFGF